jgi:hypothetical protein
LEAGLSRLKPAAQKRKTTRKFNLIEPRRPQRFHCGPVFVPAF